MAIKGHKRFNYQAKTFSKHVKVPKRLGFAPKDDLFHDSLTLVDLLNGFQKNWGHIDVKVSRIDLSKRA